MIAQALQAPSMVAAGAAAVLTVVMTASPTAAFDAYEIAVLRGLDKLTARVSTFQVPVGGQAQFGSLDIVVHTCQKQPPEETPEAAAFLEVLENRPNGDIVLAYSGWMFASSPGVSAMDHPTYDVWVLDCRNTSSSEDLTADDPPSE